jgi:glycosyltransferase involved in cell wall biosynthesis
MMTVKGSSQNLTGLPPLPQRILIIITKLELGGAQQIALQLAAHWAKVGHDVHVIAGQGGWLDERARTLPGVRVHLWANFKHEIAPWNDMVTFFRLIKYMVRHRITMVHTHSSKAGILGRGAAWVAQVPWIIHTIHGWPFHEYQIFYLRWFYITLEQIAAWVSHRLIAVSAATRDKGLKYKIGRQEQYRIIFPGSDLTRFKPLTLPQQKTLRRQLTIPMSAKIIGMVACLKPQKAPLDFVRAAAKVVRSLPETYFILLGDGELRGLVEHEIRQQGLQDRFLVLGFKSPVHPYFSIIHVLAHSSLWEGLPCVFAQAHARGIPIVATDVEGAKEIIVPNVTGILVPPKNPDALAQGIIQLLRNTSLRDRMGQQGRRRITPFSFPYMLKAYDNVLQEGTSSNK